MLKNKKMIAAGAAALIVLAAVVLLIILSGGSKIEQDGAHSDILYYTCGMHPDVHVSVGEYNSGSVNCPICNMKLVPVKKEATESKNDTEKKILFYRNPMNPAITSPTPAKDEMGMDYVPVYEEAGGDAIYYGCGMEGAEHVFEIEAAVPGMKCPICGMPLKKLTKEEADKLRGVAGRVMIKKDQVRLAGVKIESVKMAKLSKEIRTVGRVAFDPDLATAEDEYLSALKAAGKMSGGSISEIKNRAGEMVNSAEKKLRLLGLSLDQINELKRTRKAHTNLVLPEKTVWIYGDVYEYEMPWLKQGEKVVVTAVSLPGEEFAGVITSINPVLDQKTRSVRFRAEVANPDLKLKPEMHVDVVVASNYVAPDGSTEVLVIPKDALLDTGARKIVWFEREEGKYEGREIVVGPEATLVVDGKKEKYYPVLKGIKDGERVVTRANFLIDSQSQLSGAASSAYGGALGGSEKAMDNMKDDHEGVVHDQ